MRLPIPRNRLVALTLAGALLTAIVAVGLALPGLVAGDHGETNDAAPGAGSNAVTEGAPTPNGSFTPAVATQSRDGDDEGHEAAEGEERGEREERGDDGWEAGEREHEEGGAGDD